jgi:hypothetical protein
MDPRRLRAAAATLVLAGMTVLPGAIAAQDATPAASPEASQAPAINASVPQPSYDTLRIYAGGAIQPYHLLVDWVPALVATPDGGAWVFFGAQARDQQGFGPRKVYAARFDPERQVWLPALSMPGGETQFAPAAVVDGDGVVHVVYSDVKKGAGPVSTLVYARSDAEGGWTEPVAIAPSDDAGFQMMASLTVDSDGNVHVLWRDQRLASPELRGAHPANGDLFASDLVEGTWTEPELVLNRPDDTVVAGWPHIAANGDRLVAVWSVYTRNGLDSMSKATSVQWASRPIDAPGEWSEARALVTAESGDIGGRLISLTRDDDGNLAMVSGLFEKGRNTLTLYRLISGEDDWTEPTAISSGDFGYMPAAAYGAGDRLVVVFNSGRNRNVDVGALEIGASGGEASEPVILSPAETGLQARAAVTIASGDAAWIAYMHQPEVNSAATELRVLRDATITESAE